MDNEGVDIAVALARVGVSLMAEPLDPTFFARFPPQQTASHRIA